MCAAIVAEMRSLVGDLKDAAETHEERTTPKTPERIGPYRIIRKLGEGGMGVVFEAEQQTPKRRVALKLIRAAGVVDQYRTRLFGREMQTLARLNHPGVAAIYDAGVSAQGQSYFAMELVVGVDLVRYIADRRPPATLRERLQLFSRICDAVVHAHQHGVIHRDLKPSNIMVAPDGAAKVLDFGLARFADSDDGGMATMTESGRLVGTLQYMSPEQAHGDTHALDVRTDVYSLGVILYQMLTGVLPYDVSRTPLHESVRIICEQPPVNPRTLNRAMPADVATIVLMAVEKEPNRRYQSARELGADVQRFLTDHPIEARPPSSIYHFRMFTRRNKVVVGASVTIALAVLSGMVATGAALARALRAEETARVRAVEAENARRREQAQRERAEFEAETAAGVNKFLNDMLASVNPAIGDREITVLEVLSQAARNIQGKFPDRPLIEAKARRTIGRSYMALGKHALAEPHLLSYQAVAERERGANHADTLFALSDVATLRQNQGRYADAEPLFRRALDAWTAKHGDDHAETLKALNNLALLLAYQGRLADAEPLLRRALEGHRRVSGDEHIETLDALGNVSAVLHYQGKLAEAEPLARESLVTRRRVFGDEHANTLVAVNNLGTLLAAADKIDEAEPFYYEALDLSRRLLGPEHPDTILAIANLAGLLRDQGKFEESEKKYCEALALRRSVLGEDHPDTIDNRRSLGLTLRDLKQYEQAESLLRAANDVSRRVLGADHPDTIAAVYGLALVLLDRGRANEAEPLLREAVERAARVIGESTWKTSLYRTIHGEALTALSQFEPAEAALKQGLEGLAESLGQTDRRTQAAIRRLVKLYDAWGKPDEAERWKARRADDAVRESP